MMTMNKTQYIDEKKISEKLPLLLEGKSREERFRIIADAITTMGIEKGIL